MEKYVQQSFDQVLDQVKDPESGLAVSQLGLVERFRYDEKGKKIYVFTTFASHRPGCATCAVISMAIQAGITRELSSALGAAFPGFEILFLSEP